MATSQNGWQVQFSAPSGEIPEFITGRVLPGDVDVVMTYLCERLDEIEKNVKGWSWGWAVRAIRGQTSGYSNHASATAIDYNAPAHPLGVHGTWSALQVRRIREVLAELDGVVVWGNDWSRPDGMHFEISGSSFSVERVAHKIRNNELIGQRPDWKPQHAKAINFGKTQEQFLIAAKVSEGKITRLNGVGLIQKVLNRVLDLNLEVDGICGEATLNAWGKWEERLDDNRKGKQDFGRPRIPDRTTFEALAKKGQWEYNNTDWN